MKRVYCYGTPKSEPEIVSERFYKSRKTGEVIRVVIKKVQVEEPQENPK